MQQPLCRSFVAVVAMSTKSFGADLEAVQCHSTASRSTPKLRLVMHTFSLLWAMQRCSLHQAQRLGLLPMREAIKKEKPNKCDADELDIYSLHDSLAVVFQYPPHYPLIDIYSQSQQEEPLIVPATSLLVAVASMTRQFVFSSAFNCAFGCGLPVCSWQHGKWIREEKMSASLRDTSEPGAWCFVLSSFCNASAQIDVIVYNFLMYFCSFAR